jgi:hypothetical protein
MTVPEFRDEAAAAFEARKELGPDYEHAVLESFVTRATESIDRRVDARLAQYGVGKPPQKRETDNTPLALAICSLIFAIPLTAISAAMIGYAGMVTVWVGIVAVNIAYAIRRRPGPDGPS